MRRTVVAGDLADHAGRPSRPIGSSGSRPIAEPDQVAARLSSRPWCAARPACSPSAAAAGTVRGSREPSRWLTTFASQYTDFGPAAADLLTARCPSATLRLSSRRSTTVTVSCELRIWIGAGGCSAPPAPAQPVGVGELVTAERDPPEAVRLDHHRLSGRPGTAAGTSTTGREPVPIRVDLVDRLGEGTAGRPAFSRSTPSAPVSYPARDLPVATRRPMMPGRRTLTSAGGHRDRSDDPGHRRSARDLQCAEGEPQPSAAQRTPADQPGDRQQQVGEGQPDRERQQAGVSTGSGPRPSTGQRARTSPADAITMMPGRRCRSSSRAATRRPGAAVRRSAAVRRLAPGARPRRREPRRLRPASRPAPSTAARTGHRRCSQVARTSSSCANRPVRRSVSRHDRQDPARRQRRTGTACAAIRAAGRTAISGRRWSTTTARANASTTTPNSATCTITSGMIVAACVRSCLDLVDHTGQRRTSSAVAELDGFAR